MSKKNIARSAFEGGRANYGKNARKQANVKDRQYKRNYCYKSLNDEDYADAVSIKEHASVGRDFTDKLNPGYRWLRSHVGEPWSEVRAKLHKKFDSRTIAGKHILYDHLLKDVDDGSIDMCAYGGFRVDFYVDDSGILRLSEKNQWNRYGRPRNKDKNEYTYIENFNEWSAGRMVIDHGNVQYWTALPTDYVWKFCHHSSCNYHGERRQYWQECYKTPDEIRRMRGWNRNRYAIVEDNKVMAWVDSRWCYQPTNISYRQDRQFTKQESEIWANLHPTQKKALIYNK